MNGQNDIPRAEVPDVFVSDPEEMEKLKLELIKNPDLYRVNNYHEAKFTLQSLEAAMDKKRPLGKRISSFIAGESKLSRGIGSVLDFVTLFVPFGKQINTGREALRLILGRKQKQKDKPMLKKILSIKNFINVKDENENLSFQEIAASVIQLVIAGAVVWGAVELGIWDQLIQFLEAGK